MECDSFIISASPSIVSSRSGSVLNIEAFELAPLDNDLRFNDNNDRQYQTNKKNRLPNLASWKGPLKTVRLLLLVALLPALFIAVPLYLRFHVFSGQLYPVGMSDMRMIDKKVSTTWCQSQLVQSNATFNAFLMSSQPELATEQVPVSMTRQLSLEDDMKEYWGFYLLQGSVVTVSTCVRWPGASLIMIRGHRHLQECAYIGDDSSEELEEIIRANGGKLSNATLQKLIDQPSNRPKNMTRHLSDVRFHEPRPPALKMDSTEQYLPKVLSEEKDTPDSQVLRNILIQLKMKQDKKKKARVPAPRPSHIVPVPELLHRHRQTNINEEEEKWLSFKDLEKNKISPSLTDENPEVSSPSSTTLYPDNGLTTEYYDDKDIKLENGRQNNMSAESVAPLEKLKLNLEERDPEIDETNHNNEGSQLSSSEIFEDVFNKLNSLGSSGKNVLNKLNHRLFNENVTVPQNGSIVDYGMTSNETELSEEESRRLLEAEEEADMKIETLRKLLVEIMDDKNRIKKERILQKNKQRESRSKRELYIEQQLAHDLNEDDEKGNAAIEEDFEPDGIADHHVLLNETTLNDMSRSEFWSSFSSSEEALLECDGLILNLPLTPDKRCVSSDGSIQDHDRISIANTVTYKVPTNGYYFFVFNSENEVQTNYIRVRFDLKKTVYDLSKGTVAGCKNTTGKCSMPLTFFSEEKVVFEVPVRDNDSLWNEDFVVISECEPRTAIYIFCVIAVPLLIVLMAFQ